ncbi:hypothetical protein SAMN05444141_102642 [Pseudovibrio denitrificans]|uniref:Uncharacterized protein n=1 Tax=Pseudovibrio denitrificans TaxID=258256 RepID=A0A1I6ZVS2_9HYPH|nr:hypothetical protein [Pseudovibrio denitrificans]SFT66746.1 hypothetical protein SAMN05444141_102642 [Pseudovibrio denitrificans]
MSDQETMNDLDTEETLSLIDGFSKLAELAFQAGLNEKQHSSAMASYLIILTQLCNHLTHNSG